MICVSIGRGRHKQAKAEHRHLVEQGAQLVEMRLDYINGRINLKRLLQDRPGPMVITCRRQIDGGKWSGSEEDRLLILRAAIAEGVEYVDLEEDIAGDIPRFGKTKRIVSLHDFQKTPENLEEIHAKLAALDADVVKIATIANSTHDNVRMLRMLKKAKIPTSAMCMGEIGTPTRILSGKFGGFFTYATFHHERSLAPGQLSFRQMQDIYRYEKINAETEIYGVIADPIGHSLSPLIHNAAFEQLGMNKVYIPLRVPREDLSQFFEDCRELEIRGLSVTIPHKETIVPMLTQVDGAVRGIGAANTVVFEEDKTIGYNTDFRAAMDCLDVAAGLHPEEDYAGKTALILGAGGASKAIAFGLKRRGADVFIAGRTKERAQELADRFDCHAVDWQDRHRVQASILINGTPVGMHPNVDESPYQKDSLLPSMIVFDTVYNPEQTLLIKYAREKGCKVITGVEMFVRQAALQFRFFTGQDSPTGIMREALMRAIDAA